MNDIVQVITTVGFPIAMCLLMAWYVKYVEDKHKNEIDNLRTVIEQNTIALTKLCERLGVENDTTRD